jgi:hypothetical protein
VRIWRARNGGPGRTELLPGHVADPGLLDRLGDRWAALLEPDGEALAGTIESWPRLGELAEVCGAATVAEAYALEPALIDGGWDLREQDPQRYAPFVVSGNIEPFRHTWAGCPVRYLRRSYRQPVIDTCHAALSVRRVSQIRSRKLVLSGLARRPTCLWDARGIAAGKSTVLIFPRAGVSGPRLAAALNGELAARVYRLLFGSLSLAGGYLRFGPPQLRMLPISPAALD